MRNSYDSEKLASSNCYTCKHISEGSSLAPESTVTALLQTVANAALQAGQQRQQQPGAGGPERQPCIPAAAPNTHISTGNYQTLQRLLLQQTSARSASSKQLAPSEAAPFNNTKKNILFSIRHSCILIYHCIGH